MITLMLMTMIMINLDVNDHDDDDNLDDYYDHSDYDHDINDCSLADLNAVTKNLVLPFSGPAGCPSPRLPSPQGNRILSPKQRESRTKSDINATNIGFGGYGTLSTTPML